MHPYAKQINVKITQTLGNPGVSLVKDYDYGHAESRR